MEPRLSRRGMASRTVRNRDARARFNGAAPKQARNVRAILRAPRENEGASMEPRLSRRGMRPRPDLRFQRTIECVCERLSEINVFGRNRFENRALKQLNCYGFSHASGHDIFFVT